MKKIILCLVLIIGFFFACNNGAKKQKPVVAPKIENLPIFSVRRDTFGRPYAITKYLHAKTYAVTLNTGKYWKVDPETASVIACDTSEKLFLLKDSDDRVILLEEYKFQPAEQEKKQANKQLHAKQHQKKSGHRMAPQKPLPGNQFLHHDPNCRCWR